MSETSPASLRVPARPDRRVLGYLAAAGTLPYLTLKVLWLSGHPVGLDAAVLADPSIAALNGVTVGLDVAVVVLALALTHRWGRRLPALTVLLPAWVGTGFLLPIAVAALPGSAVAALTDPSPDTGMAPWLQPVVYGGFAWQGTFLLVAFALYARDRWAATVTAGRVADPAVRPLLRALLGGGIALAALAAGQRLLGGVVDVTADGGTGALVGSVLVGSVLVGSVHVVLAVAAAVGTAGLARGGAHRGVLAVAAWSGSATLFAWGLYGTALTVGHTALAADDALTGLTGLAGLLAGFALAVAGLLTLTAGGLGPRRSG